MTPAIVLTPPTEPDAIPREAENLRRARTVFARAARRCWGGLVNHGATLTPAGRAVTQKAKLEIRRVG